MRSLQTFVLASNTCSFSKKSDYLAIQVNAESAALADGAGIPLVFLRIAWIADIEASATDGRCQQHCCCYEQQQHASDMPARSVLQPKLHVHGEQGHSDMGWSLSCVNFLQGRKQWHRSQLEKLNSMGPGEQYAATGQPVTTVSRPAFVAARMTERPRPLLRCAGCRACCTFMYVLTKCLTGGQCIVHRRLACPSLPAAR